MRETTGDKPAAHAAARRDAAKANNRVRGDDLAGAVEDLKR
jgi:hypothetical protein